MPGRAAGARSGSVRAASVRSARRSARAWASCIATSSPRTCFSRAVADGSALVKVLDFGISKITEDDGGRSAHVDDRHPGHARVHVARADQELEADVDERTDIWALGLILAECLTGRPVYRGRRSSASWPRSPAKRCPTWSRSEPTYPRARFDRRRCLEKDPARRFESVAALARALAPFAGEGSGPSVDRMERMLRGSETTHVWKRRPVYRRPLVWFALLGAALGTVFGIYSLRYKGEAPATVLQDAPKTQPSQAPAVLVEAPTDKPSPIVPAPPSAEQTPANAKVSPKSAAPAGKSSVHANDRVRKPTSGAPLDGLEDRK